MPLVSSLRTALLPALAAATPRPAVTGRRRILLLQPDHLGDILLSEPAVRLLRHHLPNSELIAVVGPWSAEITRMAWPVDRILEFQFPAFSRGGDDSSRADPYRQIHRDMSRLRAEGADDALVLRDDAWWAAWLARGATGRYLMTSDDRRARQFASHPAETADSVHRTVIATLVAAEYLRQVGCNPDLNGWDMSPQLRSDWRDLTNSTNAQSPLADRERNIIIHPGSGAEVKLWPVRKWRSIVRQLTDVPIILTGSASERGLCEEVARGFDHVMVAAGNTSLPQLADLFSSASLAVGTDNGPIHLAGSIGTPTVRLFGPSNPDRYGPWPGTAGQRVVTAGWSCPRCDDLSPARNRGCGCMSAITLDQVIGHIRELLPDAA